jgi:DNA-binding NarL/FixJ family response regulator
MGEPAKRPTSLDLPEPNLNLDSTSRPPTSRPLRVLIGDDYESVRIGLCAILNSADIEVCGQAKNGEEAVQRAIQLTPDLVILDISMPGMGGVEAARQIRTLLPDVPILFFTMHNSPQVLAIAKAVGVQGFVTKDQMSAKLLEGSGRPTSQTDVFQFLAGLG